MEFPQWVPVPVREFLAHIKKSNINNFGTEDPQHSWSHYSLSDLQRLSGLHDERMKRPFQILIKMKIERDQWFGFMYTAWTTIDDYAAARARTKHALNLKRQIEAKSAELAKLLVEATDFWPITLPHEFDHVGYLLEVTESDDPNWKSMLVRMADVEELNDWRLQTPRLSDCLQNLVEASKRFVPMGNRDIIAAISVRQKNPKTEYIRAFAENLMLKGFDVKSARIQEVIAITTEVALDNDATVDINDVRQALRISRVRMKG